MLKKLSICALTFAMIYAFTAAADVSKEIKMLKEYIDIEKTMVYSVSKKEQKLSLAPAIVTVYTSEQIKDLGFTNLTELFQSVPGLFVRYVDDKNIMDAHNSRNIEKSMLLVIDIVPLISANYSSNPNWMNIPIESIKQIEIIRGPGSVVWGANAYLGLINIITKDADSLLKKNKISNFESSVSFGSWETTKFNAGYALKLSDNFKIYVNGSYYQSLDYVYQSRGLAQYLPSLYGLPGSSDARSNEDVRNRDYSTNINFKLDYKNWANFSYYQFRNKRYSQNDQGQEITIDKFYNSYYNDDYDLYKAEFKKDFENNDLQLKLILSHFRFDISSHFIHFLPDVNSLNLKSTEMLRDNKGKETITNNIDFQINWNGINKNNILLGLTYNNQYKPDAFLKTITAGNTETPTIWITNYEQDFFAAKTTISSIFFQVIRQFTNSIRY